MFNKLYKKILKIKFKDKNQYNIRLCKLDEVYRLRNFINSFWKKNHILVKNEELLFWQHKQFNQINFILAEHKKTKKIHGILGIVSKNFFRKNKVTKNDDVWIAIIKVEKSLNPSKGLGTSMIKFLVEKYRPKTLSALGISLEIERLYGYLGFKTDHVKQYYIRNNFIKKNEIAIFKDNKILKTTKKNLVFNLKLVDKKYLLKNKNIINKLDRNKDFSYLKKRFIDHPIYEYNFFSIIKNNKIFSILVARSIGAKKSKCLRVVDIINLHSSLNLKSQILEYIKENNFEYIDFVYFGAHNKILKNIGFKETNKSMVVPNYFEPFIKKEMNIPIAYLSNNSFEVFKADSDLDRPSKVKVKKKMSNPFKIRFGKYKDKKDIMLFIGKHWAKNHILSDDQMFFDFQYRHKDNLQFILALDSEHRIVGVLGYIQYDLEKNKQDIALALWKVIPNLIDPILGIKLIQYLRDNINYRCMSCVGINEKTISVYKFMGFKTGKLGHYAAFNTECKNFSIAIPPLKKKPFVLSDSWNFKKTKSIDSSLEKLLKSTGYKDKIPNKSNNYILKRYVKHPYFFYTFHEVYKNNIFLGLVISREVKHLSGRAIRIIDVLAEDNDISQIINEFAITLNQSYREYEYIDVYGSNLDEDLLKKGNYELISDSNKVTVPDYFSPFEQKNHDIHFFTTSIHRTCLFKGDGDQDNPRRWPA